MTSDTSPASQEMIRLVGQREQARARVDELDAEQRSATEARELARAALIQAEREGVSSAQRAKFEKTLNEAEARAAERWPERIEGARQGVRDRDGDLRRFVAEHLDELVAEREAEGEAAAARLSAAAASVVAAHAEREAIASQIGELCAVAGARVRPGDVTFTKSQELSAAAQALIMAGGETPPKLRRDPRQPVHGVLPEREAVA